MLVHIRHFISTICHCWADNPALGMAWEDHGKINRALHPWIAGETHRAMPARALPASGGWTRRNASHRRDASSDFWMAPGKKTGVGGGVPPTCVARANIDLPPPYSGASPKPAPLPVCPVSRQMPLHESARVTGEFGARALGRGRCLRGWARCGRVPTRELCMNAPPWIPKSPPQA
jgi:hypothetical protein